MENKGLTLSIIFEAQSANYGEGFGNITQLKKLSRGDGNSYSYISRQAIRYNIIQQLKADNTPVNNDDKVVQFDKKAQIDKYPEIDLFGYMKTGKNSTNNSANVRSAVVRLSNAISLENYNSDIDFLTNMGLAKRKEGLENAIAQSEIHKSYYAYTITIDLDRVGVDENDKIDLQKTNKKECAKRVKDFLNVLKTLYRDIKGRRENLSPIFAIGGVYKIKNPFFENRLCVSKNILDINTINQTLNIDDEVKNNTFIGYIGSMFSNSEDIQNELKPKTIAELFDILLKKVDEYYA